MYKSNFEKPKYEQQLGLEPKPKLNSSSKTIAKPSVIGSLLSHDVSRFIEWLHIEDEWNYSVNEGLWFKYGYRSRTTQQLFDYYMKLPSNCR